MLISTKGRYALRIMIDIAEHQTEGYIPLRETAQRQEISEKYLEGILKTLVQKNMLAGMRGKKGGYKLVKPPEFYTVGSILQTVERSISPVSCLELCQDQCSRKSSCRTLPLWQGLDTVITDYLEHVTLADLMNRKISEDDSVN